MFGYILQNIGRTVLGDASVLLLQSKENCKFQLAQTDNSVYLTVR